MLSNGGEVVQYGSEVFPYGYEVVPYGAEVVPFCCGGVGIKTSKSSENQLALTKPKNI